MNLNIPKLLTSQFDRVDNSPLVIFRMMFGFLIFAESAGAIFTGWVKQTFIDPSYTFTIIGFEWLQPLPGPGMYFYFGLMAIAGIMIMIGFEYKISIATFTLLWTVAYMMQKSHYNNHYYLLILLGLFMWLVPAHGYASLDAKRKNSIISLTCPRWCISIFKIQLWIIFTYAAVAKLYPGWLNGDFINVAFLRKQRYPIIGNLLQEEWFQMTITYGGIAFDLLIFYFLVWRKTRLAAFIIAITFHLFNSAVFQIGVFPYLMIAICIFFFDPEKIRARFLKQKPITNISPVSNGYLSTKNSLVLLSLGLYFLIQLALPLRHHLYKGDVLWTEEGHRLAWRMMLRTKSGNISYTVKDLKADSTWTVNPRSELTAYQANALAGKPDMIWQYAQRLEKRYKKQGIEKVEIFASSRVKVNKSEYHPIVDDKQDLSSIKWQWYKHANWILSPKEQ